MFRVLSTSHQETQTIARHLGELVQPGDLICLIGELGTGKTTFVQGLGQGLGVSEPIISPTFTLIREHRSGRLPLYHIDCYRLSGADEAWDLGLADYLDGEGVCAIEWADRIIEILPPERLTLTLRWVGDLERQLVFEGHGERYATLVSALQARLSGGGDDPRH